MHRDQGFPRRIGSPDSFPLGFHAHLNSSDGPGWSSVSRVAGSVQSRHSRRNLPGWRRWWRVRGEKAGPKAGAGVISGAGRSGTAPSRCKVS